MHNITTPILRLFSIVAVALIVPTTALAQPAPNEKQLLEFELRRLVSDEGWEQISQLERVTEFLTALTENETWLRELLDSGPVRKPDQVVKFLNYLWSTEPQIFDDPIDRSMAVACALEMGMADFESDKMVARFNYFRDNWRDGKLNSCYGGLATWERRFLAHGVQWKGLNEVPDMEYLRDRISWPRSEYIHACWQAPYRGENCFGDSVQGPKYYTPFSKSHSIFAQKIIEVGGVCGGLSNTGAAAAIANGIPAVTMGEPGHCAYAVQNGPGQWTPAYSLSWQRGVHFEFFRNTWPALMLTQACFENETAVHTSNDFRRQAHWIESQGDPDAAAGAFGAAIKAHPLNYELWEEVIANCKQRKISVEQWKGLHRMLVESLGSKHEEPAWHLLTTQVYPEILSQLDPSQRAELFVQYLSQVKDWGGGRWDIEAAWGWMVSQIGDEQTTETFIENALAELLDSPTMGTTFVAWASDRYQSEPEKWSRLLEFVESKSSGRGKDKDAVLVSLIKQSLPAAAESGDIERFQQLGKMGSKFADSSFPSLKKAGIEPFPGQLLSSGGSLKIQNAGNNWDNPLTHWGVLEKPGGFFHTKGASPWIEVRLKDFGELSGIVIANRPGGNKWRADKAKILVSTDGKEWTQVATLEGAEDWYRVDLQSAHPQAGWIRIEGAHDVLHFHRVCVYGKKVN